MRIILIDLVRFFNIQHGYTLHFCYYFAISLTPFDDSSNEPTHATLTDLEGYGISKYQNFKYLGEWIIYITFRRGNKETEHGIGCTRNSFALLLQNHKDNLKTRVLFVNILVFHRHSSGCHA